MGGSLFTEDKIMKKISIIAVVCCFVVAGVIGCDRPQPLNRGTGEAKAAEAPTDDWFVECYSAYSNITICKVVNRDTTEDMQRCEFVRFLPEDLLPKSHPLEQKKGEWAAGWVTQGYMVCDDK